MAVLTGAHTRAHTHILQAEMVSPECRMQEERERESSLHRNGGTPRGSPAWEVTDAGKREAGLVQSLGGPQ